MPALSSEPEQHPRDLSGTKNEKPGVKDESWCVVLVFLPDRSERVSLCGRRKQNISRLAEVETNFR